MLSHRVCTCGYREAKSRNYMFSMVQYSSIDSRCFGDASSVLTLNSKDQACVGIETLKATRYFKNSESGVLEERFRIGWRKRQETLFIPHETRL